jgi:RNA polymerase sigma-70 factor (ECF subfamily)
LGIGLKRNFFLFKHLKKSKEQQFKEIINLYSNDINRIAYSYLKDKELAKDVTQNTLLKAFEKFNVIQKKIP